MSRLNDAPLPAVTMKAEIDHALALYPPARNVRLLNDALTKVLKEMSR